MLLGALATFAMLSACDSAQEPPPVQEDSDEEDDPDEEEPQELVFSGPYGGTTDEGTIGLDINLQNAEGTVTGSGYLLAIGNSYPIEIAGRQEEEELEMTLSGDSFGDFYFRGTGDEEGIEGSLSRVGAYPITLRPDADPQPESGTLEGAPYRAYVDGRGAWIECRVDVSITEGQEGLQGEASIRARTVCPSSGSIPISWTSRMDVDGSHAGASISLSFRNPDSSIETEIEFGGDIKKRGDEFYGLITGMMPCVCGGSRYIEAVQVRFTR